MTQAFFDHSCYEILRDMGSLIGGGFALIAGLIAYGAGRLQATATRQAAAMQVESEQRKCDQELETFRKSLALELRQIVGQALITHKSLGRLATQPNDQITARIVENLTGVTTPIIYPAVAHRIADLKGQEAMDVVIFC
jgi:predicted RNA-binding Zn ribbon-like protein